MKEYLVGSLPVVSNGDWLHMVVCFSGELLSFQVSDLSSPSFCVELWCDDERRMNIVPADLMPKFELPSIEVKHFLTLSFLNISNQVAHARMAVRVRAEEEPPLFSFYGTGLPRFAFRVREGFVLPSKNEMPIELRSLHPDNATTADSIEMSGEKLFQFSPNPFFGPGVPTGQRIEAIHIDWPDYIEVTPA